MSTAPRTVVSTVADFAASYAVGVAMAAVAPRLSIPAMIAYKVGTIAVSSAVGRAVRKSTAEQYDEIAGSLDSNTDH